MNKEKCKFYYPDYCEPCKFKDSNLCDLVKIGNHLLISKFIERKMEGWKIE